MDTISAIVNELARLPVRRDVIRLPSNDLRLLMQQVAKETVSQTRLRGKQQAREVVTARKLYALLAVNVLGETHDAIAKALHKDRSSVGYMVASAKHMQAKDRAFRMKYARIRALWT